MTHTRNQTSLSSTNQNARSYLPPIVKDNHRNKGSAFTVEEKTREGLRGLVLPTTGAGVETLELQVARSFARLSQIHDPLCRFSYLDRIRNENTTLFYALIDSHLRETIADIYTPTVGKVCQEFSHIYTPGTVPGLFISIKDKDDIDYVLQNWRGPDPDITVITDGSRILGLGDLGVNGMGIPVGKLSLYTAAAGVNPEKTLPICLDMGTDTERHLEDPFYMGLRSRRPDDASFFEFTDAVMAALKRRWPNILVQFEDFSSEHAFALLDRHRNNYFCFNDDIQGTGAVILAGFINAINLSGIPITEHRILFTGAGSAGVGVASQLRDHFIKAAGLSYKEATNMFWLMDSKGLITDDRKDAKKYPAHKTLFMRKDNNGHQIHTLEDAVRTIKPTALVGLSSVGGVFTPAIITMMAEFNQHPIIFPLSNPLLNAECTFESAMKYTNGNVLFASGTAFPACPHPVTGKLVEPGQGNNMYIFPGLGLGSILAKSKFVTDDMVYRSAVSLAGTLTEEDKAEGLLYPRLERIREVSGIVARDVILESLKDGLVRSKEVLNMFDASNDIVPATALNDAFKAKELLDWTIKHMYVPTYGKRSSML